jgi:nitronate monooxygenase
VATSAFLDQLRITHPIIQAPMAGVSTPALAAAVSNAGGLGSLGLGASSVSAAEQAIEATRALTSNPFNVNLFCHQPAVRDDFRERAWLSVLAPEFARFGELLDLSINEDVCAHSVDLSAHLIQFPCHQALTLQEINWMLNEIEQAFHRQAQS